MVERTATLHLLLEIIDEGLRIYRHGFVSFTLISASWFVPVAIGSGVVAAATAWNETAGTLLALVWLLLLLLLSLYLVAALSRAALLVQQGQRVQLRAVLAVGPRHIVGMGCYSVVFSIVANMLVSMLTLFVICPLFMATMMVFGSVDSLLNEAGSLGTLLGIIVLLLALVLLLLLTGLMLLLSSTTYSALIYGLQPFVQRAAPLSSSIDLSVKLVFYRFGSTLLAFVLSSTIFAAVALSVSLAIGVLLPLPLFWVLGSDSPMAQAGSGLAWLLGLIVVLPPLPIWMALLYQHNLASYQGDDLRARIAALERDTTSV